MTSARAISSRRRSPPDSTPAGWLRRLARLGYLSKIFSAASFASRAWAARSRPSTGSPRPSCRGTPICPAGCRRCRPGRASGSADSLVMSRCLSPSPIRISPEKMLVKPYIECSTVDLPAPFGPIRHSDWPAADLQIEIVQDLHLAVAGTKVADRHVGSRAGQRRDPVGTDARARSLRLLIDRLDGDRRARRGWPRRPTVRLSRSFRSLPTSGSLASVVLAEIRVQDTLVVLDLRWPAVASMRPPARQ